MTEFAPCCVCIENNEPQTTPTEWHHVCHDRFMMANRSKSEVIPLCRAHHRTGEGGKLAIHKGKKTWRERYGADWEYL